MRILKSKTKSGWRTRSHAGDDALHPVGTEAFDLAVLDVTLPRRDCLAVLETFHS